MPVAALRIPSWPPGIRRSHPAAATVQPRAAEQVSRGPAAASSITALQLPIARRMARIVQVAPGFLSATSYPQLTTPTSASLPRDPALLSQNGFTTAEDLINYARLCRTFTNGWDKFYASFDTMRSVAAGTPAFLQMFRVASKAWDEEGAPASYAGAAAAAPRSGMGDVNGGQE